MKPILVTLFREAAERHLDQHGDTRNLFMDKDTFTGQWVVYDMDAKPGPAARKQ
tara:strand:+ start:49 stop:210 length:162 start_codon:yes stop_codon:yes gene_type:complete